MHAPLPPSPKRSVWRTTRRALLIGGGATVGLAVGWAVWPRDYPLNLPERDGVRTVNAWLRIAEDGRVIVVCPQAEMGQGTHSGMAQIVADELGADWRTVEVEPAPLNPLYANKYIFDEMTEALPGPLGGLARWTGATVMERLDAQLTGGSTSIKSYDGTLREAGAAARTMLMMAAARRWDMDWRQCSTRDGWVVGGANRARFAELAAAAAEETPPDDIEIKPIAGAGAVRPRLDIPSKVDGSATYGADVRLPGMVYAAIRHGPVGDQGLPELPPGVPQGALAVTRGPGWAAVVADRWYAAKLAAEALTPKWRATAGLAESTALDAALAKAVAGGEMLQGAGVIEASYRVPYAAHAALEPQTATARVADGRVEVWAPTQSTRVLTYAVARALGVPEETVTVYPTLVGGGFGRKVEVDAGVEAAVIARDVKRPVQLIWSREEEFRAAPMRPAAHARYQARLEPDGSILAWRSRFACQAVGQIFSLRNVPDMAFGVGGPDPQSLEGAAKLPYACPDVAAEHVNVPAPVPVGYWRSVANSYTGFMNERFVDRLAAAAKQDPLSYRLKLLAGQPRHRQLLQAVAERAGYQPGMGVALHQSFGSIVAVVAQCALEPEPAVERITIGVDCGRAIAPDSVRQQMEGSVVWALSAAFGEPVTYKAGYPEQQNLDAYPLLGLARTPAIDVVLLTNPVRKPGGVGEPGVPPVAPAVANAFSAMSGRAFDRLPLRIA